jgi:hypothetical protein
MTTRYKIFNPHTGDYQNAGDATQIDAAIQDMAMNIYNTMNNANHTLVASSDDNWQTSTVETYSPLGT